MKFDYKVITIYPIGLSLEAQLKHFGLEGWQLLKIQDGEDFSHHCIFIKPLFESNPYWQMTTP